MSRIAGSDRSKKEVEDTSELRLNQKKVIRFACIATTLGLTVTACLRLGHSESRTLGKGREYSKREGRGETNAKIDGMSSLGETDPFLATLSQTRHTNAQCHLPTSKYYALFFG